MKKVKLRNMTVEQFDKWIIQNCITDKIICEKCPFRFVNCYSLNKAFWINNKNSYDDKFLNQEIEIEE